LIVCALARFSDLLPIMTSWRKDKQSWMLR
jgi:hypothetical protein